MGNTESSTPNITVAISTKAGQVFHLTAADLIDHVLLLRQAIVHPEVTESGPVLDSYVKDYCQRMAKEEMRTKEQQKKIPWQIEWIWHVHRLHPVAYHNDCVKQLPNGKIVDKKVYNLIKARHRTDQSEIVSTSTDSRTTFVPSIDLAQAAIRQRDFLSKFRSQDLYSKDINNNDRRYFKQLVQNYVSFMKLARKGQMTVPTFDIDLIWHTHMRRPLDYRTVSTALCGFVLDHDDAIERTILSDNYQKTAERWEKTYKTNYDRKIERKTIQTTTHQSSRVKVYENTHAFDYIGYSSLGAVVGGYVSTCGGGCDGGGGGDGGGGCDGGGCGGGCGGG